MSVSDKSVSEKPAPSLTLYNTLTRRKEAFTPIDPANVRMYVCGPTVYDFAHIGNARPVIVFDVLNRLLRHLYGKDHVKYVRNITDVDDKINARALRDFPGRPLNEAIAEVTRKTADQFHEDVKALGCLEPDVEPRATDNIAQMIAIIATLLEKKHAYLASGEVLFDVASMKDYGALSNRSLDQQQAGARVAVDAHKKNPGDFVLWKLSSAEEPGWESPWGRGRPGWHIECSAMSERYLGETFDIHGGGIDLVFPHHENEIAQSRCAFGHGVMANVWMHNGFLQVEGEKMSKSLGNFITIHELLHTDKFGGRKWPGEVLRLAMLKTHYRQPIDWTVKALEEASKTLIDLYSECYGVEASVPAGSTVNALLDDLNCSQVISVLHSLKRAQKKSELRASLMLLGFSCEPSKINLILGRMDASESGYDSFSAQGVVSWPKDSPRINSLILTRLEARKQKNWAESDRIRDELVAMGIQLKDGKDPVTGEAMTTWEVKR